jgi:protein-ribulosamine 3-kinase
VLPGNLKDFLETKLALHIKNATPLAGGCINNAVRLDTSQGIYCLKWNTRAPAGVFPSEAHGLTLIASSRTIRVPMVHAYGDPSPEGIPGYILLEWIQPPQSQNINMASLGEQLALLHRGSVSANQLYGLDRDNFIGSSHQINTWSENWPAFFSDRRLSYQANLALKSGRLPAAWRKRIESIQSRIDELLPNRTDLQPSLLHGDLWAGNVISASSGMPVLIDPAVYYGDREAEIAYTELFGGFSPAFYQAYQAAFPLDPGYTYRRNLYNLYHLLNHLNIFGEMYGPEVDTILKHYAA